MNLRLVELIQKNFPSFLDDNSKVFLLVRPNSLTSDQEELLRSAVVKVQRPGYGLARSLTSGVFRFGFWAWLLGLLGGNVALMFPEAAPWFVFLIYNFVLGLLFLVMCVCARPEAFNRVIEKLRLPSFMKTDVDKHFCSQLVVQLDKLIQGGLSKVAVKFHELRPKDVERLALKKLGYKRVQLKPQIAVVPSEDN